MDDLDQNEPQMPEPSQDVDAYINYYGLNGDPFDPRTPLFFATAQLEKSLRLFNYLARFSRKLVVVTGPSGAGKTSLLENFVNGQDEADLVCSFAALASDSPTQVLLEMAEQLSVPDLAGGETPGQLSQAIREYSLDCLDHDIHCMVVIDDAERFEPSVLEQLYRLVANEPGQRCGISLLLCGQPELISNVQQVIPAEIIGKAVFHQPITAFNCDEVSKYLHLHFIENAGQSKAPFSQNEVKTISEQSGGLPGRINDVAKQALLAGMGGLLVGDESAKKKSKSFAYVLAGLLAVAGAGFLWWQNTDKQPQSIETVAQSLVGQIEREADVSLEESAELSSEQIFAEPASEIEGIISEAEPLAAASGGEGSDVGEAEEVLVSVDQSTNNEMRQPESTVETVKELAIEAVAKPDAEEVNERAVATHALAETIVDVALPVDQMPLAKPVGEDAFSSRLQQDMARILAFKAADFTMQLLGSHKEESILKILDKLPADGQAMYFQKVHKGAPWYVLIYGNYPNRGTANAATASLPKALKGFKPWVRGVSGIQDTIKANQ